MRIPVAQPSLGSRERDLLIKAFDSGWISSKGEFITQFEKNFSKFCSRRAGVAVSNGTVALHLALKALGTESGDEVLVPDLTFASVPNSVYHASGIPVLIDIVDGYWGIDPDEVKKAITPKTKGIIAVHLYGHPCNLREIQEIAEEHDLWLVEDAAEAHGAKYEKRPVGSFGSISCFSFYGNKIITTGEGGMCLTDDLELEEKLRMLRDHGMALGRRYWHDVVGFNHRMTNLQAALGVAQLERIEGLIEARHQIDKLYREMLSPLPELNFQERKDWADPVCWFFCLLSDRRDKIIRELDHQGLETRPFFFPLHEMPPYKIKKQFPIASRVSRRGLNLPTFVGLSVEDIEKTSEAIIHFLRT